MDVEFDLAGGLFLLSLWGENTLSCLQTPHLLFLCFGGTIDAEVRIIDGNRNRLDVLYIATSRFILGLYFCNSLKDQNRSLIDEEEGHVPYFLTTIMLYFIELWRRPTFLIFDKAIFLWFFLNVHFLYQFNSGFVHSSPAVVKENLQLHILYLAIETINFPVCVPYHFFDFSQFLFQATVRYIYGINIHFHWLQFSVLNLCGENAHICWQLSACQSRNNIVRPTKAIWRYEFFDYPEGITNWNCKGDIGFNSCIALHRVEMQFLFWFYSLEWINLNIAQICWTTH